MEPQDAIKYGENLISVSGDGWTELTCTTEEGFRHVRLDDTGYRYGECESTKSMVGCATLNLVINQKWLPDCLAYATTYYEDAEPEEFDKCASSFDALGPQKLLSFEGPEFTNNRFCWKSRTQAQRRSTRRFRLTIWAPACHMTTIWKTPQVRLKPRLHGF